MLWHVEFNGAGGQSREFDTSTICCSVNHDSTTDPFRGSV
jgi:hypothetical protein